LHGLKSIGKLCLLACLLSVVLYSASAQAVQGKTFTAAEWDLVVKDYNALAKTLAELKQINLQQRVEIETLKTDLTIARTLLRQSTEEMTGQKNLLTKLKLNLTASENTLASSEIWKIIGWTVAGISISGNIVQGIILGIKK
jgi:hypothetical protein